MNKKKILVFVLLLFFINGFVINSTISFSDDSRDTSEIRNVTDTSSTSYKIVIDKSSENLVSRDSFNAKVPSKNILNADEVNFDFIEITALSQSATYVEDGSIRRDESYGIRLAIDDTPNIIQIYYERLDGNITTYGLAGETLEVHVIVKGLISSGDTIYLDVRRDIVSLPDSDLYNGYYDFTSDLLGSESIHIYWTVTLDPNQGDFGLGFGDIRSYFLIVYLDSGPTLFDGSGIDNYRLWMCGDLRLYGVQYYNYTLDGRWVPVSYAVPGWDILVTFYVAVINAPIWGFDIQGVIKADVVWGIDETWYSDDEKTISGILEPGIYYYNWSDIGGVPYYFTVPMDTYGNSPGDIRSLFGVIYMDAVEIEPLDPDLKRDQLNIIYNTISQPPLVNIELPLDGYVTYNDTLSLAVDLTDPNSNYDITTVEILLEGAWLDVSGFYHPDVGRLDIAVTNAFTINGIKNVTVKAIDNDGNVGYDSVIIQYFSYGYFFPQTYSIENTKESLVLFDEEFRYDHYFNWGDEDNNVTITPYFTVNVEASVEYELLLAYPSNANPGEDFNAYIKVANPEIMLSIDLDLGVDYTFMSGENYYSGSSSLYQESVSKGLPLSFGIFRIDLRDISPLIKTISHLEIETQDFLPGFIDWLANFKLEVDFIPIVKIKNLLAFDISGTNCNPAFDTLHITTNSLYAIPCTASSTANGNDDVTITLDNFNVEAAAGFEAYCQLTFSGKLVGIPIGPIDVNKWLYEHLGIQIPYLDLWLIGVTIPVSGFISINVPLNPLSISAKIVDMFYSLDNITYKFEIKDANGNFISGASVSVDDHSQTYSGMEESLGIYVVVMGYYNLPEVIDVTVIKSGYITLSTSFDLYVDPPAVTKSTIWEYTIISTGIISLLAITIIIIRFRLKRRLSD